MSEYVASGFGASRRWQAGGVLPILAAAAMSFASTAPSAQGLADGLTSESAAASCSDLHARDAGSSDGVYWVSRQRGPAVQVYCDMATDGGGWQILFRSSNPKKWRRTSGIPGSEEWSVGEWGVPDVISELRLMRVDTRERKFIPITAEVLYECTAVDSKHYWNGTTFKQYNALHLGITTAKHRDYNPGYVIVGHPCIAQTKGWGFGHRGWIDDQQGWGWDSVDLGPTIFQIAVR